MRLNTFIVSIYLFRVQKLAYCYDCEININMNATGFSHILSSRVLKI